MKGELFRFPVTFTPQAFLPQTITVRISKHLTFFILFAPVLSARLFHVTVTMKSLPTPASHSFCSMFWNEHMHANK